jgi:hypothetical protein
LSPNLDGNAKQKTLAASVARGCTRCCVYGHWPRG